MVKPNIKHRQLIALRVDRAIRAAVAKSMIEAELDNLQVPWAMEVGFTVIDWAAAQPDRTVLRVAQFFPGP